MTTLHPSAPASRMAHARHPRLRREISAFQPLSAHSALTRISISLPNCRLLVSECMFCSVVPLALFSRSRSLFLPFRSGDVPGMSKSGPPLPLALLSDECRLDELWFVLALLMAGDSGISCASGCGRKLVMASMTRTRGVLSVLDAGAMLGAKLDEESLSSCSRVQFDLSRSSERWMAVYV